MSVVTAPNTGFSIVRDPNSSIWQILYLEPFFLLSKACGLFFFGLVWFGIYVWMNSFGSDFLFLSFVARS